MKSKKKKPKVNPLDISQAKAKAVRNTILMAEYVLQSKHGFDRDQIIEFLENMTYVADAIQEGRLNMTDINNANRQEIHLNTISDIYSKQTNLFVICTFYIMDRKVTIFLKGEMQNEEGKSEGILSEA